MIRTTDGVSGEYAPARAEQAVARPCGGGLAGLDFADNLERAEQARALHLGELASVHSWELVTAVDGPGTRMTVFFSGCPLRCLYCHNPDTMEMRRGEMVPASELIDRMMRYQGIFRRSGGGITLSGGEPLMQPRVVARLLESAKAAGIHTAIDTSGNLGWRCTDAMLENLDLCLLDIKSGDEMAYERATGAKLAPTLDFAGRLSDAGVEVWVRFVLVPGLTDDPQNIERVAKLAAGISTCTRVEVLPFHQMGRDKWETLGMEYKLADTEPPTKEAVSFARKIFADEGLVVY
jgi:pyruvate formate-lyase 1-activating enzyme